MNKRNYCFEEWKKKKIERGEWLSLEDYKRKQDLERREWLLKELEEVNKRLFPKNHSDLKQDFVKAENEDRKRKREDLNIEELHVKKSKKLTREIILDTETTGLGNQDRIVEISMLELVDGTKTGRRYHKFLNPEINITKKATEIHKITNEKVENCQKFSEVCEEIIKFIGDATIIAHNSNFDMRMLNNELTRCGWEKYEQNRFIDTLEIAKYLFPKEKNNQDALCQRFKIDNHNRMTTGIHSAIEDTAHLYLIYQELIQLLKEKNLTPYDFKKCFTS